MSGWTGPGTDHEAIHLVMGGRCAKTQDRPRHFRAKHLRCLGLDEGEATWPARRDEIDLQALLIAEVVDFAALATVALGSIRQPSAKQAAALVVPELERLVESLDEHLSPGR